MTLSTKETEFLGDHHSAAMITVASDGIAKAARIGIVLFDGRLWSSGTADRVRTKRLRRDPRCTLFVFDAGYAWMALETTVTILDGPDTAELSLQMFRAMQNKPTGALSWFGGELDDDQFRQTMVEEKRLIYQFEVHRAYGMY